MRRAVIDQAGLRVVMIGIILSLFIGLIFKSQIRPNVVKSKLQQALIKVQKDVNVDFESVEVRLSEWGIPRPVVEIRGVRISPLKAHCQENQIYIDNLSFPLSFDLLLSENKVISTVRISLLEMRTKNTRQCFSNDKKIDESSPASMAVEAALVKDASVEKPTQALQKLKSFKSHLNEIKIDRLRLIAVDRMNTAVDANAVQLLFKYDHDKLSDVLLSGQLLAFKESDKSYYLFKSDLKATVKLAEKPVFTAELKGLIVDRPFLLKVKNDLQKNSIQFLGEIKAVSLKALNYIVKTERPQTDVFDFLSGSSVSGFITGEYFLSDKSYDFDFKNVKLVIGGGAAEVNDIYVFGKTDEQAQVKPFDIQLSDIELTKILLHPAFDGIRPSIQNAGLISGLIQFTEFNQFKVKSLIEKTSFVFSNKGERVYQTFDSFNFYANVEPQKINLNINDFILDSRKIKGAIKYNFQNENQEKSLIVDLEGKLLKSETVRLFTGVANEPEIKLYVSSDLKNNLKGSAQIDKLSLHQFELSKLSLDYERNLLLKNETYNLKTGAVVMSYASQNGVEQFNGLFENIFPKPTVSFDQSRIVILRDGLGRAQFTVRADQKAQTGLFATGEYITSEQKLTAKGNYGSQNFLLSGPWKNLTISPFKQ